jgi:DNA-binding PadR family transcriptional regulator
MRDVQLLILTALAAEAMHGHRMQLEVTELSGRPIGPGTLYGAIDRLERDGFVRPLPAEGRRKPYELTERGRARLAAEVATTRRFVETATQRLGGAAWTA